MKKRSSSNLKKVIVDYKKLNNTILDLLITKYPDGYDQEDIIAFKNAKNEIIECVEVETDDTLYLVKVSKRLVSAMEDFDEGNEDNTDKNQELLGEQEIE